MMSVVRACAALELAEGKSFAGRGPVEATTIFKAMRALGQCVAALWQNKR